MIPLKRDFFTGRYLIISLILRKTNVNHFLLPLSKDINILIQRRNLKFIECVIVESEIGKRLRTVWWRCWNFSNMWNHTSSHPFLKPALGAA